MGPGQNMILVPPIFIPFKENTLQFDTRTKFVLAKAKRIGKD
jgi:hypothetical protein